MPAAPATAAPETELADETMSGMHFDFAALADPSGGFPMYRVWESAGGITVKHTHEDVVTIEHGATLREAIDQAAERMRTRRSMHVLDQEGYNGPQSSTAYAR
jgi:hypothetical protein